MRGYALALLGIVGGCASGPRMWTPAGRLSAATCAAPGAPSGAPWQLVTAQGFTFCVPPDWRTADGRRWQGADGSVQWGLGTPPRRALDSGTVAVRVPMGGGMPSPADIRAAAAAQGIAQCNTERRVEQIGGQTAALYDAECDGQHHTGAQWETLGIYLQGEAGGAFAATLQLQIYRTVRFGS